MSNEKTPLLTSSSSSSSGAYREQGEQRVSALLLWSYRAVTVVLIGCAIAALSSLSNRLRGSPADLFDVACESVDPHPILAASSGGSTPLYRPASAFANSGACQGPKADMFIPVAPLETYATPQAHPVALLGSHKDVGMDANICITSHDRYSMYTDEALGVTYRRTELGETHGVQVHAAAAPNFTDSHRGHFKPETMDLHDWESLMSDRVRQANLRSEELGANSFPDWRALMDTCFERRAREATAGPEVEVTPKTKRTALVIRMNEDQVWSEDVILNMRALVSELSLNNRNTPYDVRILLEVFKSKGTRLEVLQSSIPREFWGLVELWNEEEMRAVYSDLPGKLLNHQTAQAAYRSTFMPLQKFSLGHQEYDFIYNWEESVRYIGNYLDFFEGIEKYSRNEPLDVGMQKYRSWLVRDVEASQKRWADNSTLRTGRNEEADLITLGPIFNPAGSGWFWEHDVHNYARGERTPRLASIGTNMRFSRSLLRAMHVVNAQAKKSSHCEAWPTTLVLHSQLPPSRDLSFTPDTRPSKPFKGVFAPHPVYFGHRWDAQALHSRLSRPNFYSKRNEKIMRDASFYNEANHAKEIYVGWMERKDVCRSPVLLQLRSRI